MTNVWQIRMRYFDVPLSGHNQSECFLIIVCLLTELMADPQALINDDNRIQNTGQHMLSDPQTKTMLP